MANKRIIALSIATDLKKAKYLQASARLWGWELVILDGKSTNSHTQWKNTDRLPMYLDYLKENPFDAVLLLDAYDTVIQQSPQTAIERLEDHNWNRIVIEDEAKYKTYSFLYKLGIGLPQNFFLKLKHNPAINYDLGRVLGNKKLKHNNGAILGNYQNILQLLKALIKHAKSHPQIRSDQHLLGSWALANQDTARALISIVTDCFFWHVGCSPNLYDCKIELKYGKKSFVLEKGAPIVIHRTSLNRTNRKRRTRKHKKQFKYIVESLQLDKNIIL